MRFKKIYVEITNRCNLNCSFCSRSNRNKKDMTVSEFEKYIEENEVSNMVTTHLIYYGILDKANYKLTAEDIDKAREYIKAQSEKNNFDFSAYSDMYIESYAAYTAASNILRENAKVK